MIEGVYMAPVPDQGDLRSTYSITKTTLFCNNQATLQLMMDDNYHACTKHIDICIHFIHQTVKDGSIDIIYCPTDDMTADICWSCSHDCVQY